MCAAVCDTAGKAGPITKTCNLYKITRLSFYTYTS